MHGSHSLQSLQTHHHETSNRPVVVQYDLDETRDQTFQFSGTSGIKEMPNSDYIMAQHNQEIWSKICARLEPLTEPKMNVEATLNDFVEATHYFNDESLQKELRRTPKSPKEFIILKEFFQTLTPDEKALYQEKVIPGIAKLILETETIFPNSKTFPLLKQGSKHRMEFSKKQCACLLAHMTICITCHQGNIKLAELIDFSALYRKIEDESNSLVKIKCIFTYFEEFFAENSEGKVVFERSFLEGDHTEREWERCEEVLTKAEIKAQGSIEDTRDALQVVFSDKNFGGRVSNLVMTTSQQQIMSFIHPELLLSCLFCEELQKEEALRVYGAARYSNYKGYGSAFEHVGAFKEDSGIGREHVMIDAERYQRKQAASQFHENYVLRELNKAYAGFQTEDKTPRRVATGKWGCGVFKGNAQLKFMIQWLAASRAGREIIFYLYGDTTNFNIEDVKRILGYYERKEVGELFRDLRRAMLEMQFVDDNDAVNKNLFGVLIKQLE